MSSETISLKKIYEKIERLEKERDLYREALKAFVWQNNQYDDDIMTDGSVASEALAKGAEVANEK